MFLVYFFYPLFCSPQYSMKYLRNSTWKGSYTNRECWKFIIFSYLIWCFLFLLSYLILFSQCVEKHPQHRQFPFKERFWSSFSDGHSVIQTWRTEINGSWKHFPLGKSQMRLNETFYIYSSKQS